MKQPPQPPAMFSFISPQAIHFGRGSAAQTAKLARKFGPRALIVHGATPARATWLIDDCRAQGMEVRVAACRGEPSLPDVEASLKAIRPDLPDCIIALGGGAVIDFAKALAALLPSEAPALDHLEGVGGGRALDHAPLPMIALPTTAGTGAETTKNAVIFVPDHGVKTSLRDPRMVPDVAIVDAALMQSAPRGVALAAGLDAITQVIEPYLCNKSNPITDALCLSAIPDGLAAIKDLTERGTPDAWDTMARVATMSGLALANAGLGAVHGFAGVIGGHTGAPHGEICAALLPPVLASHGQKAPRGSPVRARLDWIETLLDQGFANGASGKGRDALQAWAKSMGLRGLGQLGLDPSDIPQIATASAKTSSMKATPFALSQAEREAILHAAS